MVDVGSVGWDWVYLVVGLFLILLVTAVSIKVYAKMTKSGYSSNGWAKEKREVSRSGSSEKYPCVFHQARELFLCSVFVDANPSSPRKAYLFCFGEGDRFYPVLCDGWSISETTIGGVAKKVGLWSVVNDLQDPVLAKAWPDNFAPIADIPTTADRERMEALVREALCFYGLGKMGQDYLPDTVWAAEINGTRSYISDYF